MSNFDRFVNVYQVGLRAAGYHPDNQDWFWVGYMPNGALMQNNGMGMAGRAAKGMETGCIACHSSAPGGDMVFINDRHAM
jgi:hypothetical protein